MTAQSWTEALAQVQAAVERHEDAVKVLHKLVAASHAPADMRTVKLTATRPTSDRAAKHNARSFTVVNPYAFALTLGVGGVGASNVAAFVVPPKSTITVPITAENLELGAAPADLAAGDAYVFVFLYDAPRPFAFAAWAG